MGISIKSEHAILMLLRRFRVDEDGKSADDIAVGNRSIRIAQTQVLETNI